MKLKETTLFSVLSCYKDPTTETCRNLLAALIRNAVLDTQNSIVAKDQEELVNLSFAMLIKFSALTNFKFIIRL